MLEQGWLTQHDAALTAAGDFVALTNDCHQQAVKAYRPIPIDFTLSRTQLDAELAITDEQLGKAGVRLAAMLNQALGTGK